MCHVSYVLASAKTLDSLFLLLIQSVSHEREEFLRLVNKEVCGINLYGQSVLIQFRSKFLE